MKTKDTIEAINDLIVHIADNTIIYDGNYLAELIHAQAHLIKANAKAEGIANAKEIAEYIKEI